MSTELLFRTDPYLRECDGIVLAQTPEGGIVVDRSVFYTTGGGQPGDSGMIRWNSRSLGIATAFLGHDGTCILVPSEPQRMPAVGAQIHQTLDWDRRYRHMRIHTALHLLSVVIPLPVTGGAVGAGTGRLDFSMTEPPKDRDAVERALNMLVDRDLSVTDEWITDAELDANPGLVKTRSVQPPRGSGHVRLVRIGRGAGQVDLQPCGGTHVARTAEIGHVRLAKIENKGQQNRRIHIALD
ncbi:alanyl-tRNA editing protein [Puniceibacterium sp. IMCC21224]|uniref:alanyl-tRNA editing protein n=1 Tax=Puniceibacterium sp. IMCC21224 TaxID=1618204 RepID=UPI00064E11F7|nr:alanyl-tRNA editing protein [Puniceibacterium sp. IMCC21224]KMK67537.1 Ala-tRNA(Pro) hydrolase [Puniceibacterium sp. IMCC21224]